MNVEKLKRLQTQVRIGGKGTARRKKKVMHQTATTDDKKLQSSLKKLSVSTIPGIEEVNIIKDDLTVIHFNNPKAQASLSANTFAVTGHGETKKIVEMLPDILPQLGQETVVQLRMFANSMAGTKKASGAAGVGDASVGTNMLYSVEEEDDVPMLVSDFDEVAKLEAAKITAPITTNSEQPASEADKGKKNTEIKDETVEVLPTLSEEGSNTETINTVKKVNELKSLENLNLNIKLNEESGQKNVKSANNETECKKEQTNLRQENINKTEKEMPTKDAKKLNELQKKNENKNQQKQEPAKQKAKSEQKPQKNSKDNRKSEESAMNINNSKKVESEKVIKIEEAQETDVKNVGVDAKSDKPTKQQQKPLQQKQPQKQLKTEQTFEKQQRKDKQLQQSEQKQETDQEKKVDIKENQNKLQHIQGQKTNPDAQGQVGEQKKLSNKQDNEKQQTPSPKLTPQEQQKNNQQIKQKNKSGQQKEPNQDLQAKTENEQRAEKTETQPQTAKQPTAKQQKKASDEGSIEKKKGPKQAGVEKQTAETTVIQRKTETQVKGSQQEKKSTASQPVAAANNDEQKQQTRIPPKENKLDIQKEQKLERQSDASINKDNLAVLVPEKQTESETPIVDVSIKTVALQSLESTEKLLGIVNEITKEFAVEGLKEDNGDSASKAELTLEKRLEVIPTKECATSQASDPTAQLLPTTLNTVVTLAVGPVEQTEEKEEIELNIVDSLAAAVEKLPSKEKLETLLSSEKLTSKDKTVPAKELTKELSPAQILQSHSSPAPTLQNTLEEQLGKQSSLAEIAQSQPGTSMLIKDTLTGEEKTQAYSPIPADPLSKQLTMAEAVQAVPAQISPNKTTVLQKPALTDEMKDIPPVESLRKENVKDAKSDSTASKEEPKLIGHSQASEVKLITPETLPTTPEKKNVSTPTGESPKQKVSPPKQTKSPQEIAKQQTKVPPAKEAPKTSTPADAKLKLITKPLLAQQKNSSKGNAKPMSSKSASATPTTPTTPTKISPEKCVQTQKSTAANTKIEATTKKTNSPQKQVDVTAKSKQQPGVAGKAVRPGGGNVSVPSGGPKKGNTPPAVNKTSANAGVKQQETSPQDRTNASSAGAAQPEAAIVPMTPPPAVPATENTANSNQSPPST